MKNTMKAGRLALGLGLAALCSAPGCATMSKAPTPVKAVLSVPAFLSDVVSLPFTHLASGMGRIYSGVQFPTASYGGPYWSNHGSGLGCGTTIDVTPLAGEIIGDFSDVVFRSGTGLSSWSQDCPSESWWEWAFARTDGLWKDWEAEQPAKKAIRRY